MKKNHSTILLILTLTCAILFSNTHTAEAVTTSRWYTKAVSFKKIEKAAKEKKKPYILFFYTNWCGYCKRMKRKYLSNTEVKKILSKYYRIKINPDTGRAEQTLAREKGAQGYPDFRIVYPNGKSIRIHPFQRNGSVKVAEFIKELKAMLTLKGQTQ